MTTSEDARAAAIALVDDPGARAELVKLDESMRRDGYQRDDPIRDVFALLGDRWSMLILLVLATGTYRHALLKRVVGALGAEDGISQRVLTLKLRTLERNGFVLRTTTDAVPPQVDYRLSEAGRGLVGQVQPLFDWIRSRCDTIEAAREAFKAQDD